MCVIKKSHIGMPGSLVKTTAHTIFNSTVCFLFFILEFHLIKYVLVCANFKCACVRVLISICFGIFFPENIKIAFTIICNGKTEVPWHSTVPH